MPARQHKKSDDPKLPACLTVALCLFIVLLICCAKSDDRTQPQTPDSKTKEDKTQTTQIGSKTGENQMKDAQNQKVVFTSPLAQRGWYPADAAMMRAQINGFFEKADVTTKSDLIALIMPHAGYRYSGQTAAYGVKTAAKRYKRVVVIGPSHYVDMPGALSVPAATHYSTPLGLVPLDTQFIARLKTNPVFRSIPQAHQYEHSVQIEVPLLQYDRPGFKLVPIVAGRCSLQQINSAANTLLSLIDNDTLVVASSDFVHYGPNYAYTPFKENIPEEIKELDMGAFGHIANLDPKGFLEYKQKTGATICGYVPIAILLTMCEKNTKTELLKYATSGEMMGDFTNSVSYLSVAFRGGWKEKNPMEHEKTDKLSDADKKELLKLARRALEFYLRERKPPTASDVGVELTDAMKRRGAAFVTLKKHGMLRGCIGDILPRGPLCESVIRNAVNAGFNDYRFPPVTDAEPGDIVVEISALTVPVPIDSPDRIRIGTDGVILRKQGRSAVFLPQVAPEQGWDIDQMLSHLSVKAGLSPDAWKQDAEFLVFQADVFGEHE
jgi:AmmeMemoRadiSam system protein B/AmmeMemoRadiSam system protein A